MPVRRTLLIAALAASLAAGCAAVPGRITWPSGDSAPSQAASPAPSPPATASAPATSPPLTPSTPAPSPTRPPLTAPEAARAMRAWVSAYNATLRKPRWWRQNTRLDALFIEGALHEGVLERNHEESGQKPGHKPIALTGAPVIYLPRPDKQPPNGDWFVARATYKDTKGRARPHVLAFFRSPGQAFRLAVATPIHWGRRMPKPLLDADGYVTDMDDDMAAAVAEEYRNFWNHEKKEGASGYRLAKDSFSRKAFPAVYKGLYVRFAGHGSIFGFRTADGGSFFLFALINSSQSVNQVLSEALLVPKGGRTIEELGANWFS
ncbi:hypothetical protein Nocox_24560 [Nonomuraea coxensis DSM 45129]|uniref:DUF8094 domain-containing protein n=2 Tax=Nonomuraea coxensis TaxID=404386 RepID=A0ABX8U4A7_9ACTN|nr:hypothetical protein Nocox_24560 [Nonomuraea coxensis DSM 45129]